MESELKFNRTPGRTVHTRAKLVVALLQDHQLLTQSKLSFFFLLEFISKLPEFFNK
jgi:hypothetical protein